MTKKGHKVGKSKSLFLIKTIPNWDREVHEIYPRAIYTGEKYPGGRGFINVPGSQGVGLQGPMGSRGRPSVYYGSRGRPSVY